MKYIKDFEFFKKMYSKYTLENIDTIDIIQRLNSIYGNLKFKNIPNIYTLKSPEDKFIEYNKDSLGLPTFSRKFLDSLW